jgi:hypothetical protein
MYFFFSYLIFFSIFGTIAKKRIIPIIVDVDIIIINTSTITSMVWARMNGYMTSTACGETQMILYS